VLLALWNAELNTVTNIKIGDGYVTKVSQVVVGIITTFVLAWIFVGIESRIQGFSLARLNHAPTPPYTAVSARPATKDELSKVENVLSTMVAQIVTFWRFGN